MKCFESELWARWPQLALVASDRNAKTWAWRLAPNLVLFVLVQTLDRVDQFVVEVAWSEDANFPWGAIGRVDAGGRQGRERLSRLWDRGAEEPVWDAAPEKTVRIAQNVQALRDGKAMAVPGDVPLGEVLPRVPALVADAVQKLDQHAIPLFRQVAEARQAKWPE
jgi:hypothetical protein